MLSIRTCTLCHESLQRTASNLRCVLLVRCWYLYRQDRSSSFHGSAGSNTDSSSNHGNSVKDCYTILNIKEGCNHSQLKDAYIRLAKIYHPDSGSSSADPAKFDQIKKAYRTVKQNMVTGEESENEAEVPQVVFDIKHTAPQHRQYLNFDGIGYGTPGQRERQYQKHRVAKATERVADHRIQKIAVEYEDSLIVKDKQAMKKHKTQSFMDRLVEDLIKEAMEKGDFQDLPGTGKPLETFDRNPFVDSTTHNLNKILINDGFAPGWITLEKEIRQEIKQCREVLAKERSYLGSPPLSPPEHKRWIHHCKNFRLMVDEVNTKIYKYNMIVPFLKKQMVLYDKEKIIKLIFEDWEKFLPKTETQETPVSPSIYSFPSAKHEKISWYDVWKNIKSVFSS